MEQPDYEAELIAVAKPFWDAEAEITRRFFAGKPSREDYLRYRCRVGAFFPRLRRRPVA